MDPSLKHQNLTSVLRDVSSQRAIGFLDKQVPEQELDICGVALVSMSGAALLTELMQ